MQSYFHFQVHHLILQLVLVNVNVNKKHPLDKLLFQEGGAVINVGISVSRVGSAAQIKAMKKVAGKLKLELAQFAELEAFSQFASDLDKATQAQWARGQRLREILKQAQNSPIPVADQVAIIYIGTNGFLDDLEISDISSFIKSLREYIISSKSEYLAIINSSKQLTPEAETILKDAISEVKKTFKI